MRARHHRARRPAHRLHPVVPRRRGRPGDLPAPNGPVYWGIDLYLGLPELFGQGIGTQVVRDLSDQLLADGTADMMVIDPQIRNQRAIRSYAKAGFSRSHPLPHHELHDGDWMDAVLMTKTARPQ